MNNLRKSPEEYLKEPYTRIVTPDEQSGTFTAQILEFPGCIAEGKTVQKAYKRLEQVARSWIEAAVEQGQEIPLPFAVNDYGGKFALRLPKSLHKQAALAAERDGTSLNQFVVMAISEKVGASNLYENIAQKFEIQINKIKVFNTFFQFMGDFPNKEATPNYSTIYKSPEYIQIPISTDQVR